MPNRPTVDVVMILGPSQLVRRYLNNQLRHLRQDQRGSAAVETALLLLPLLTILMAMIETGYMFFIAVMIEGATAEASRQIRTGLVQNSGAPISEFRERLCENMFGVVDCADLKVDVRNFTQFSGANPPPLAGDGAGNTFAPGGAGDIIVARVSYKAEFITPFLDQILSTEGGDGSRLLISSSAFRNEPFGELGS